MTNTAQQLEGSSSAGAAERWHQLDQAGLERLLDCSVQGLSETEARLRLERHGPNRLEDAPPPSDLAILLHEFRSPLIFLLLATVVTVALAEYLDAAVIATVVVLERGHRFRSGTQGGAGGPSADASGGASRPGHQGRA